MLDVNWLPYYTYLRKVTNSYFVLFGAGGNPYGTSVTVSPDGKMIEDVEGAVKHQAKRTVEVATMVKNGSK